ncbi:MAG: hypothetical protein J7642_11530 [Cyanobacteria bacterium SBC]|nr:hypothetical protein [Cyanobacteria bacterium SBC]
MLNEVGLKGDRDLARQRSRSLVSQDEISGIMRSRSLGIEIEIVIFYDFDRAKMSLFYIT